jgi:hypothetical protein
LVKTIYPPGHYYSPLIDNDAVRAMQERIWPASPVLMGIDLRNDYQKSLLSTEFPNYAPDFLYPQSKEQCANTCDFYIQNDQYTGLDALALFCFLRTFRPKRLIEAGCGYSTLLSADVNRRFFNGGLDITCIEPYPADFIRQGVPGVAKLFQQKIEEVPLDLYSTLEAGDFLFIDTSHVAKTGSDVNHIYFEILPRLKPGVIIHIHDIFFPDDYPKKWVIDDGRGWNEQYILRALLMFSNAFEVLFGCYNAYFKFPDLIRALSGGALVGGGSLWIRKTQ